MEGSMSRLLAAVLFLAGVEAPEPSPQAPGDLAQGTLYFFFSPANPFSPAAAKTASAIAKKGKLRVRPVLLVEDWTAWKKPTEDAPLYRTLRELGGQSGPPGLGLPVYDLEGLRLARTWNLSQLPAFVLAAQGKAHVVYGTRLDLEDLTRCGR
jgi:hypothetical protein